jgi:hypothetical protein
MISIDVADGSHLHTLVLQQHVGQVMAASEISSPNHSHDYPIAGGRMIL